VGREGEYSYIHLCINACACRTDQPTLHALDFAPKLSSLSQATCRFDRSICRMVGRSVRHAVSLSTPNTGRPRHAIILQSDTPPLLPPLSLLTRMHELLQAACAERKKEMDHFLHGTTNQRMNQVCMHALSFLLPHPPTPSLVFAARHSFQMINGLPSFLNEVILHKLEREQQARQPT